MRNRRAALLNLIPGFGLGYLVLGRRRELIISLLGWLGAAVVAISIFVAWFLAYVNDRYLEIGEFSWIPIVGTLGLGFLAVNVPGAIHLGFLGMGKSVFVAATLVAVLATGGVLLLVAIGPGRHTRTVYQLAFSLAFEQDRTLLARTDGDVYHSSDGGDTWNQAFASKHISFLATSPAFQTDSTLFAATNDGVYRSTDRGGTWQQVFTSYDVPSLAVSPTFGTDGTLFAGTSGKENALYRSTDGGDSWRRVFVPRSSGSVRLALSPAFETDGTLFAFHSVPDNEGVYRSTDGGDTWRQVANPGPSSVASLALSPAFETDGTLFAYTGAYTLEEDSRVYRSTDGGDSWRRVFVPRARAVWDSPPRSRPTILCSPTPGSLCSVLPMEAARIVDVDHPLAVSCVPVITLGPPLHPSHDFLTVSCCWPRGMHAPMTPVGKHRH